LKVLHVINSLSGSGGAEQGLVREIEQIGDRLQQSVVTLYGGGTLEPVIRELGIEVSNLGLRSDRSVWNWAAGASRLRRVIKSQPPDVVHSSLASANLVAQLATRGLGIAVLSTFTLSGDVSLMRAYQPGADSLAATVFRRVGAYAARANHVAFRALTEDAARTNVEANRIDPARVVVIPRGVPMTANSGSEDARAKLGLPGGVPVLLNVGRQTAQKGHVYLVEAFRSISEERPAHLVILGREGDGTPALQGAISVQDLSDHITVVPYTEEVDTYYRAADVFLFSSLMEGLGTAVLEAMAARLPVVAFDIPPVREVTDGGRVATLVPVGDAQRLARAVLHVLEDQESASRRAAEAYSWVDSRFSIESATGRLYEELKRLAGDDRDRAES
jgi:glycosyltransferase involved in cell wall biosynthesis